MNRERTIIACLLASSLWLCGCLASPRTKPRPVSQPRAGLADLHNHQFANLGFGGLAVYGQAFGPPDQALSSETDRKIHGYLHLGDPLSLLDGPEAGLIRNSGYPTFRGWPKWSSIDHQQVYYEWLKQAYDGGLRLMSMLAVSNEVLCSELQKKKGMDKIYPCGDMQAVDRQIAAANELEALIDSQSGGPGKGWYRIARSSEEARSILAQGKLAVILGVEVSNLFGCNQGTCTEVDVDRGLEEYYSKGVRQVFLVHEFNNDFAGAAMFRNALNFGNWKATGKYFEATDCSGDGFTYKFAPNLADLFFKLYTETDVSKPSPKYPGLADCNSLGLTPLGEYLVKRLMDKRMIIDVDHMSNLATNRTLELAAERHYPVISSHSTFLKATLKTHDDNQQSEFHKTDRQIRCIRDLGGLVAPILQTFKHDQTVTVFGPTLDCDYCSVEWAQRYVHALRLMREGSREPTAIAFGSDFNGVIHHVAPRPAAGGNRTGSGGWDFNKDGLAHVGLLPDFIQELRCIGLSDADLDPLFHAAEAYVRMWERIESGHPADSGGEESQCKGLGRH